MTLPVFTRLELFVMVPLLSARVPFRPRVCPFRVHVVRRLCVGFASGVVRLCGGRWSKFLQLRFQYAATLCGSCAPLQPASQTIRVQTDLES